MAKGTRSKRSKEKGRRKGGGPTLAEQADRYDLYQRSVQEPECEVEFFDRVYLGINGRLPLVLREDFCGTFAVSSEWVKKPGRVAYALDLDSEPLTWGREKNLAPLDPEAQARLHVGEMRHLPVIEGRAKRRLQLDVARRVAFQQRLEHTELDVIGIEMLCADEVDVGTG